MTLIFSLERQKHPARQRQQKVMFFNAGKGFFFFSWMYEWMDEMYLTSDELCSGLLPTIWESGQISPWIRLIRRQRVPQFWSLGKWRLHHFAKLFPNCLAGNLEDITPTTDFTCPRHPSLKESSKHVLLFYKNLYTSIPYRLQYHM